MLYLMVITFNEAIDMPLDLGPASQRAPTPIESETWQMIYRLYFFYSKYSRQSPVSYARDASKLPESNDTDTNLLERWETAKKDFLHYLHEEINPTIPFEEDANTSKYAHILFDSENNSLDAPARLPDDPKLKKRQEKITELAQCAENLTTLDYYKGLDNQYCTEQKPFKNTFCLTDSEDISRHNYLFGQLKYLSKIAAEYPHVIDSSSKESFLEQYNRLYKKCIEDYAYAYTEYPKNDTTFKLELSTNLKFANRLVASCKNAIIAALQEQDSMRVLVSPSP